MIPMKGVNNMSRVYNFSAGPSMLPEDVLKRAAAEMLDCEGSGQSVMEMSHRSKEFEKIIKEAESLLRELMNIPENYKVLFLQGGASTQFAAIPLNFMNKSGKADYIISGQQESTWVGGEQYEFEYIYEKTGKYPAIRGLDYMNDDFEGVNRRAIEWYEKGGIVSICWHCGSDFSGS